MNFCSDLAGFFIATTGGLALLFFAYLFGAYRLFTQSLAD